jgi:hypothetical protein
MENLNIHNKNETASKLNLEMLKLIQAQEAEINFLIKRLKNANSHLLKAELESYVLAACLNIVEDKYNLSRQEKRKIILQAIEGIFPDIFL